jgi:ubiquinone/menaquinone biosynthesis C-methylase UbiE
MGLLDGGCGTGSYSHALIEHVRHIAAVDMSPGMIEAASHKCERFRRNGRIRFNRARIDALPFKDETFDAVMINQVLHHIGKTGNGQTSELRLILKEISRVLRPKGFLVINTCSQKQLRHSYWYYNLIPEAAKKLRGRYLPLDNLRELLRECGFTHTEQSIAFNDTFQGDAYFDPFGPLIKEWRDGDSVFALTSEQELKAAVNKILEMRSDNRLYRFLEKHNQQRTSFGQATLILSVRD